MAWFLECNFSNPLVFEHKRNYVGPYADQNEARWWALNFCTKGSVIFWQGTNIERVVPIHSIDWIDLVELTSAPVVTPAE